MKFKPPPPRTPTRVLWLKAMIKMTSYVWVLGIPCLFITDILFHTSFQPSEQPVNEASGSQTWISHTDTITATKWSDQHRATNS